MKQKFNIITSTCVPLPVENVDTDQIIPARFLKATTREESFFGDNLFRDWRYRPDGSVNEQFVLNDPTYGGCILVAGRNFGSGSSREHAPLAIKASGIACVIAESFARIFYRNAINIGLPILECPAAALAIAAEDEVSVDLETGEIINCTTGQTFRAEPFPPFMMELIAAGGLVAYLKGMKA